MRIFNLVVVATAAAAAAGGCTLLARPEPVAPHVNLVAVLPLEPAPESGVTPRQARVVTAQIYAVLAERPELRFVPDLTVERALQAEQVRSATSPEERAAALAHEVGADAVLFGTVSRFRERVGGSLGAKEPASVAFELRLFDAKSGKVVWRGEADRTQQPLSANLLNFWMFWRGGPRWWTAAELSRLAVDELLADLRRRVLG